MSIIFSLESHPETEIMRPYIIGHCLERVAKASKKSLMDIVSSLAFDERIIGTIRHYGQNICSQHEKIFALNRLIKKDLTRFGVVQFSIEIYKEMIIVQKEQNYYMKRAMLSNINKVAALVRKIHGLCSIKILHIILSSTNLVKA